MRAFKFHTLKAHGIPSKSMGHQAAMRPQPGKCSDELPGEASSIRISSGGIAAG